MSFEITWALIVTISNWLLLSKKSSQFRPAVPRLLQIAFHHTTLSTQLVLSPADSWPEDWRLLQSTSCPAFTMQHIPSTRPYTYFDSRTDLN